ncbi:flagellar basal body rod protein FlgC [Blastochloris tepida]|jgi:flagellar basal-body rod protein FlgC|uniref:Flagellar basal-body rod protein FlgC n=1 Tax=Blastochloris tepida TaxID=2233851 RepID=A0A348FX24_9HYPH|nr:flagellar basal body rod protein FlgC [Blastochloris tepida]BBF91857.1 flagellar basal-body rod protein FlgC [Blastochloris tepida]
MDFMKSLSIAASGLRTQAGRMRIIAENLANANSTAGASGGEPYRRKVPTFQAKFDRDLEAQVVTLGRVQRDKSSFISRYEPGHPAADGRGYVQYPNVNSLIETADLKEAQRSYEANLNVVSATRRMISRTLDLLRV